MDAFENAQKLFNNYEKNGGFHNLKTSLDILDEIIEGQGPAFERAINFKKIIEQHIDTQINTIWAKGNVDEFGKALKDDEFIRLLWKAMSEEDRSIFLKLLSIKRDYFKL